MNVDDASWMARGICRQTDPEAFFPDKGSSPKEAKKICLRCEVREDCLEWALTHDERGIWGGTTDRERNKLRKAAAGASPPTCAECGNPRARSGNHRYCSTCSPKVRRQRQQRQPVIKAAA